ncbi:MAG: hypothetical protein ACP5HK_06745 [Acidilobus sp.]
MKSRHVSILLVTSMRGTAEVVAQGLRKLGHKVGVIEVPGLLFRPPDQLMRQIGSAVKGYDYVILPGTYPYDLKGAGRGLLKGPEGLGLLLDIIESYGVDVLSPSEAFEKAHPDLLEGLASRRLSELRTRTRPIPQAPPPITVISEVPVPRAANMNYVEAAVSSMIAEGADYVVLSPLDMSVGELRGLSGHLRGLLPGLWLGVDAGLSTLRRVAEDYDLLLSVPASSAAEDLSWASSREVVVLVRDDDVKLVEAIERQAERSGARPVLDPVAMPSPMPGLAGTLARLQALKDLRLAKLIGLSNVVELMDADTSGSVALLTSLFAELGGSAVLVEEASPKARGLTLEARAAADMVSLALLWGKAAKDVHVSLLNSKLKTREVSSGSVTVRMVGFSEVELKARTGSYRLKCEGPCPLRSLPDMLDRNELAAATIMVYRACLPWSSSWNC